MTAYEPVIGLEVHAQLLTHTKLFSSSSTNYGDPPNQNVCPVSLGLPGALPVPNRRAVEMAVQAGLALDCTIHLFSRFDRKHYFYPDLSKGYQISQFHQPIAEHGKLEIELESGKKTIGITRIHMEEDAAKNHHGGEGKTLVDFNRASVPLIEIVSEPDLRSAEEAEAYLRSLREILMFIGVNDGNLEEGSFRCDANVSIRPLGQEKFGTRTELKNINSFRFVRKAIEHEIARQETVISGGGVIVQETRTWNEAQSKTISMRSKEDAHDYRYFPDPDLPPLILEQEEITNIQEALDELPKAKRIRWQNELGLTEYDARVLSIHPKIASFFEQSAKKLSKATGNELKEAGKKTANFIQSEVLRYVKTEGICASIPLKPAQLSELLAMVSKGTISGKTAKEVFLEIHQSGKDAKQIVDEKGLAQISDESEIEKIVVQVIENHPSESQKFKEGKTSVIGFFVGQVMKATKGAANPKMVNLLLNKHLK